MLLFLIRCCSSKRSVITRASDDYYPKNSTTQTLHIAAVSYNNIFLGEVVVPDWDMFYVRMAWPLFCYKNKFYFVVLTREISCNNFQSSHYAAEFHAVARAVGGCGVYVR